MNLSSVIKTAPRYLILRYGSLNSYAWESLFPKRNKTLSRISDEIQKKEKLSQMKTIVDEATLLLFVFVTKRVFVEGSTAAKNAVDTLKDIGVNEFYLGNTKFSGRNENVILGDKLAEKLFNSLGNDMKKLINDSSYMSDIVDLYKNKF